MQGLVEIESLGRHIIGEGRLRPGKCAQAPNACDTFARGETCGRPECCRGTRLWVSPARARELCDGNFVMIVGAAGAVLEPAVVEAAGAKPAPAGDVVETSLAASGEPAEKKSSSVEGQDGQSTATPTSDELGLGELSSASPVEPASPPSKSLTSRARDALRGSKPKS